MMINTLRTALPVDVPLTPKQLRDLCEMTLSLAHFRKVLPEFWIELIDLGMHGVKLTADIMAEVRCSKIEGLPEEAAKTLMDSAQHLTLPEIKELRVNLLAMVEKLAMCPPSFVTLH